MWSNTRRATAASSRSCVMGASSAGSTSADGRPTSRRDGITCHSHVCHLRDASLDAAVKAARRRPSRYVAINVDQGVHMTYAGGRTLLDADSHVMELPGFLRDHADPADRD